MRIPGQLLGLCAAVLFVASGPARVQGVETGIAAEAPTGPYLALPTAPPSDGEADLVRAAAIPDDELFDQYQQNLRQIKAPAAWDLTTGSSSIVIAVLDTGVSLTHPDLVAKLVPGYNFVNDSSVPDDDHGNGTHVAGIAAASTNNHLGVAGIAWQAKIMPVKVLDSAARGDTTRVAQGIIWATDHGANVINLGLAGPTSSLALEDAITYAHSKGVVLVAPVANNAQSVPSYPAALSDVIAVGGVDRTDRRLPNSNTGEYVSLVAPAEDVPSTFRPPGGEDSYAAASTTAQAAAHVTGVAALLLSINPSLKPDDVRRILETSADDLGTAGKDNETGWGRLNAARAVTFAAPWNFNASGAGSYTGRVNLTDTVYFPLIMKDANGWNTAFTVMNAGRQPARLTITLYDQEGRMVQTLRPTLPMQGSTTFEPRQISGLPSGFVGSAVVRSDSTIAGVVNEDRPGRDRLTYEGFGGGAQTTLAPLLMRNSGGWSTGIQVQNLGTAAANVSVTLYSRDDPVPLADSQLTIPPLASRTLYQPADDRIPNGWVGSATVESLNEQPVAAVVNQVHTSGLGMSYVGIDNAAPTINAPLLFHESGDWLTGFQVQNAGNQNTTIQVTYTRTNGTGGPWTESRDAVAGSAVTFYQPSNSQLPSDFVGSAVARSSSGQPLAGIVNEIRYSSNLAMAYDAVSAGGASIDMPLVYRKFAGWDSGVQIQNVSAASANVSTTFFSSDGVPTQTVQATLAAGASVTYYLPAVDGIPNGFVGSAVATSAGGQPITGIVNLVKS